MNRLERWAWESIGREPTSEEWAGLRESREQLRTLEPPDPEFDYILQGYEEKGHGAFIASNPYLWHGPPKSAWIAAARRAVLLRLHYLTDTTRRGTRFWFLLEKGPCAI